MIDAPNPEDIAANAQEEAEQARERAEAYSFRGETLLPFSIERQSAAQRLGLRYGRLSPEDLSEVAFEFDEEEPEGKSTGKGKNARQRAGKAKGKGKARGVYLAYDGMLDDTLTVLFLCTLERGEIIRLAPPGSKAKDCPAFFEARDKWGAEKGISLIGEEYGEAYGTFRVIMSDIERTTVVPKKKGGGKPGDDNPN